MNPTAPAVESLWGVSRLPLSLPSSLRPLSSTVTPRGPREGHGSPLPLSPGRLRTGRIRCSSGSVPSILLSAGAYAHTPRLLPLPASRHLVPPLPLMPYLPRAPLAAHSVSHCYRMTIPVVPRRVIFSSPLHYPCLPFPPPPCLFLVRFVSSTHRMQILVYLLTQWFVILASPSAADEPHAPAHPGAGRMHCQPLCPLSARVGP
jgi:hypothetical protein